MIIFSLDKQVIRKILKHLGSWEVKRKLWPTANAAPIDVFPAYNRQPGSWVDDYIFDPDYPVAAYF